MAKYRKKPIVLDAVQWDGKNQDVIVEFCDASKKGDLGFSDDGTIYIRTLEGLMYAAPGWWVIKGIKGEFYLCDPDIFPELYEAVEAESD